MDPNALVAAGGWSAPSSQMYDLGINMVGFSMEAYSIVTGKYAASGTCSECRRPLVQVEDSDQIRTYHPAESYKENPAHPKCPVLHPIPGTSSFSLDVDARYFVLDGEPNY